MKALAVSKENDYKQTCFNAHYFLTFMYIGRPYISSMSHVSSQDSSLTLRCISYNAPPTSITWEKDGEPLDIDWNTIRMRQRITHYRNSYYENLLLIDQRPDDVVGEYTCTVSNKYGSSTGSTTTVQGTVLI